MPASNLTRYSNQSVTIDEVLDSFESLLLKATGLPDRQVIEWYGDERPAVEATGHLVWYRWLEELPDAESGAGRHGTLVKMLMEVNLATRTGKDGAGRDKRIGRDHLAMRFRITNAIYGRMLQPAYKDPIGSEPPQPVVQARPSADRIEQRRTSKSEVDPATLTVATMVSARLPKPNRPRPEQGYIESRMGVLVPVVLRVTINDVPDIKSR